MYRFERYDIINYKGRRIFRGINIREKSKYFSLRFRAGKFVRWLLVLFFLVVGCRVGVEFLFISYFCFFYSFRYGFFMCRSCLISFSFFFRGCFVCRCRFRVLWEEVSLGFCQIVIFDFLFFKRKYFCLIVFFILLNFGRNFCII